MSNNPVDITSRSNIGHFFTNLSNKLKAGDIFHGRINLGRHRSSKTEIIGTLFHAGFELVEEKDQDDHLHIKLRKISKPGSLEEIRQAAKLIFKQERVGQRGKKIKVLKLRSMYPMAHKAQEYLFKKSESGPHGKPLKDYRITPFGKTIRKYWIDEIPQLINIIKGEMKLVGYRALSEGFFKTFPKHLQIERLKHKPALMGVTYADRPKNFKERVDSELRYLAQHQKNPLLTDIKYFFKILWAIIFRGQRGY